MKKYLIILLLLFSLIAKSQTYIETQKIVAPDRQQLQEFGEYLAIHGDYAIVSLPNFSENGISLSGVAYIYKRNIMNVWEIQQTLLPQSIQENDNFGVNVDIEGDYAVISARQFLQDKEAVYIYKKDNLDVWNEIQKIEAPDSSINNFGLVVSLSGDYLAISNESGKIYIYEKDSNDIWNLTQEIESFDTEEVEELNFGFSLELKGNTLVVGDPRERSLPDLDIKGAIYVYERDNNGFWNDIQKLTPAIRNIGAQFGESISINNSEDIIVIGAPLDITGQTNFGEGSVYIFYKENDVWAEYQKITASDLQSLKEFGKSVGIQNNTIVVGAPKEDYEVAPGLFIFETGAVYVFNLDQNNNWNETDKIFPSDTNQPANLGFSIDFDEDTFLSGALYERYDENDSNSILDAGAAYFFQDSSTLGLQTFSDPGEIILFPNPTSGIINVHFKNYINQVRIILRNVLGQELQVSSFVNTNKISLDILDSSGLYFLEVLTDNGEEKVFKVIKN